LKIGYLDIQYFYDLLVGVQGGANDHDQYSDESNLFPCIFKEKCLY